MVTRRLKTSRRLGTWSRSALLGSCLLVLTSSARAETPDPVLPDDLEELAEQSTPEQRAELSRADRAFDGHDYQRAAALYDAALRHSGQKLGYALRRRCQAAIELGKYEEARSTCRELLASTLPNAADLATSVAALVRGEGELAPSELALARQLAARAEGLDPDSVWAASARCEIAARVRDESALEQCWARLRAVAPEHRFTAHFARLRSPAARLARPLRLAFAASLLAGLVAAAVHRSKRSARRRAVLAGP